MTAESQAEDGRDTALPARYCKSPGAAACWEPMLEFAC